MTPHDRSITSPSYPDREPQTPRAARFGRIVLAVATAAALVAGVAARAAERSETIQRELTLDAGVREVAIDNVFGPVAVRAGAPGKVTLEVRQHATARRESALDEAFNEVTLSVETEGDRLSLVQDGPFRCEHGRKGWHSGCDWDPDYEVRWEWEVTVPPGIDLAVSTVNAGGLSIEGVRGRVRAANVNGPLHLSGLVGEVEASTVNGGVVAEFERAPAVDSSFETVNGRVELTLPRDTAAEVAVDTVHGDLYSDFEGEAVPVKAVVERDGGGHRYRFESGTVFRIGGAGPKSGARSAGVRLECTTVNGDIVVRAR